MNAGNFCAGRLEIADEKKQPLEAAVEKGSICFEGLRGPGGL